MLITSIESVSPYRLAALAAEKLPAFRTLQIFLLSVCGLAAKVAGHLPTLPLRFPIAGKAAELAVPFSNPRGLRIETGRTMLAAYDRHNFMLSPILNMESGGFVDIQKQSCFVT
jgi:hypothetical protein